MKTQGVLILTLASTALFAQPAAPPLPPPPPAEIDLSIDDEVLRLSSSLARLQREAGRVDFDLAPILALSDSLAVLAPMPPMPPMPAVAPMLAQARPAATPRAAAQAGPPEPPSPPGPVRIEINSRAPEDSLYNAGARYIDRREWDRAVQAYDAVLAKRGAKAEGALYWKGYASAKAGRTDEALASLKELEQNYPKSRWIDDAKALEIEVRQAMGKPVSPEEQQDEELKLIAIHGLARQDPARAVPLLEKVFNGKGSLALKTQALFVLSQIKHPRTREFLIEVAKGKGNPDLQLKAVEILGMSSGSTPADFVSIYSTNPDRYVKRRLIDMLAMQRDVKPLVELIRAEKDPELKRAAVRSLAMVNSKEASEFLIELLEK